MALKKKEEGVPVPVITGAHPMKPRIFLKKLEKELGELPEDLHVSRMFSSLVAISNGEVIGMSEPYMEYCPLAASLYGKKALPGLEGVTEGVCHSVHEKVEQFGYYTSCRELCTHRLAIPFGASEMMMRAAQRGVLDAAVVACEGAGTVIADTPDLIQGIGARMNGLFYTSPLSGTIARIEESGGHVPFPDSATIDQIGGLELALRRGYRSVAVTINAFQDERLLDIREAEGRYDGLVFVLGVCTTGITKERAREFAENADLVWSCASDEVRQICGEKARIQVTTKIPVYVMTDRGVEFLAAYSTRPSAFQNLERKKQYLISQTVEGTAVTLGKVPTKIAPVEHLPVVSPDSPRLSHPCLHAR